MEINRHNEFRINNQKLYEGIGNQDRMATDRENKQESEAYVKKEKWMKATRYPGARRRGISHETEKIVVEKWCYFPELCKL